MRVVGRGYVDAVRNLEVTFRSLGGGSKEKMQEDWESIVKSVLSVNMDMVDAVLEIFSSQCTFWGCKNRPILFPGQMSYNATKSGLALSIVYILACFILYCCLLGPLFMYC